MQFLRNIFLPVILAAMVLVGGFLITQPDIQAQEKSEREHVSRPAYPLKSNLGVNKTLGGPALRVSRRISIPYGFDTPLPVLASGREILASGHGGCTAAEQVTVAITVTQSLGSPVIATGELVQTCTGELQLWQQIATTEPGSSLGDGPAEACGVATTRADGLVTDSYQWCKAVDLITVEPRNYLPLLIYPLP